MTRLSERSRFQQSLQGLNLDSLVDIVSNNVGILIIIAAFMALFALIQPEDLVSEKAALPQERAPEKLLVPWSHPTPKNHLYLALMDGKVKVLDLRPFYRDLAGKQPGALPAPVVHNHKGLRVRFYPVTNQVYCLQFDPSPAYGENWLEAQRTESTWQSVMREFPPERFVLFFWVGGESFELFRQMRSDLWERNYEVGWKPLAEKGAMEICNGFEGSTAFRPQ